MSPSTASGIFARVSFIRPKEVAKLLAPLLALGLCLATDAALPSVYPSDYSEQYFPAFLRIVLLLYLACAALSCWFKAVRQRLLHFWGLLIAVFVLLTFLNLQTVKSGNFLLPYVPSPDQILGAIFGNLPTVLDNLGGSLSLLLQGITLGGVAGMVYGSCMGYSRFFNYWLSPFIKLIGPVPSTAWMALAMVLAPSSHAASVCLVALSTWFPLSVNLSGGIRGVNKTYIERAQTLGASHFFILRKVIYPAVLPNIFTGLFMGVCFSLTALVGAEMLGVQSGLGWYISYAEAWSEFDLIYSTILIFILVAFTLITILFKIQKQVMKWTKGAIQW
ncbi:MAG: ABC transporter permease subunit [Coriobacteriales bacterium]|jgi:NitT/TauT family transport system permease protein|nr:ABC transporter permease subunit [Coriobacteriales bacterium]